MQNTKQTQSRVAILLALSAVFFLIVFFWPNQAYAKSYTMPSVDIQAEAQTDGTLYISEQRTFDFDGEFSAVWWTFSGLPQNASLEFHDVSITRIDESGEAIGEAVVLPEEEFLLSWRDAGGPTSAAFSVDSPKNTVYVFFDAADESLRVDMNYSVVNGVQAYKDVGEVYWKYIGDQWAEASNNVSMTLALPLPSGTEVVAGENVRAWGHGPLDGNVSINADGTISYTVAKVNAGQYAEARVVFPVGWLTNLSDESVLLHKDTARLETVLSEEEVWADQANRSRMISLALVIGCGIISLLILLWAIRSYFKHGKEYEPSFQDQYWRDIPSPQDHPAVIARLWRWDKESPDDFTATLMHLSHIGAIQINKGSYEKPGLFGSSTEDDYYLTRVPEAANSLTSPIDKQAMSFLFDKIAGGSDSLWFGTIQQYGKENPEDFMEGMKTWQGQVSGETNKRNFFEIKGQTQQMVMVVVAIIMLVVGGIFFFVLENFIPLIFLVPVAIALFVIANFMPRRSEEGNNLDAKSKALRNWLKDFSALDERPPTDVKVWGEFMVYAYIFGIAKQVMKELQLKVPELFADDQYQSSTSFVPWWFWYSSTHGASGSMMPSASDMLQTSVNNTIQTAQAAISGASGSSSSGGGFGGGFSGGGGGGFGGGGGAR
ncbi:MAG: DUF2207 domain-containing protein [Raoultibacter sp.]|jgi:uncharacterized membrane protein